jgi:hypothetical protein
MIARTNKHAMSVPNRPLAARRFLSLPNAVAAAGGIDAWNASHPELRQLLTHLDKICTATTVPQERRRPRRSPAAPGLSTSLHARTVELKPAVPPSRVRNRAVSLFWR